MDRMIAAGEVVQYAKLNLTEQFCRVFRCTTTSPSGENPNSYIAVNCLDVSFYSEKQIQWRISFSEMKKITFEKLVYYYEINVLKNL